MSKALHEAQVDVMWASGNTNLTSGVAGREKALRRGSHLNGCQFNSRVDIAGRNARHEHAKATTARVATIEMKGGTEREEYKL